MHTYIYILHPICDWAYLTSLALFHVDRQSLMTCVIVIVAIKTVVVVIAVG